MIENETLAEKISNETENLSESFMKMYSDDIGYIKILGIAGSVLPIILVFLDGSPSLIVLALSFIFVLLAMKKVDSLSKDTKSFEYMKQSFIVFIASAFIYLGLISVGLMSKYHSIGGLLSSYLLSFLVILSMALLSTYLYYKSYIELAKATGLKIFQLAAILMIVSIFMNLISETLSSMLIIISAIFIIIGWFGIKTIFSDNVEEPDD
ncbi:hypothetical protein JHD46_05710 [Sulfurimonas sp. SAG-AH-194-C20]|nr:hypothetical protein [Sulfurimonas sp. SAG-AH-194-C20]MDF1879135.1 hypothetical protein [Sulfurimonas sp. SAG-AH-194-C20]